MDRKELNALLIDKLGARTQRMGINSNEFTSDLDLVRTGLLDSLGFVDLITELETAVGKQVDLEKAFDRTGATTVGGVIDLFLNEQ